ncbi:MAG TPA: dTMP kinase [Thermoanaerobaculia bacterium]|nr:dTMP kinase [Thermoanaerobaculia bacterium]
MPLVTFEGVEGSGKTTQLRLALARLKKAGIHAIETREPGGTRIGEILRTLVLKAKNSHLDPVAEWLIFEADRRQHVTEVLKPALTRGEFVLCDRYADATEAYQQVGRGIDSRFVQTVDSLARDGVVPDLTLVYDLDPVVGLKRTRRRDWFLPGRFERTELAFHLAVRNAYLAIATREPGRVSVIDASRKPRTIFEDTWRRLSERFSL